MSLRSFFTHKKILSIALLLFLAPLKTWAELKCEVTPKDRDLINQIKKLDCEVRNVARKINQEESVVPKSIFHYGNKEILNKNIKAGTIPKESWDKFIMGTEGARSKRWVNRRGLYGTAGIATNHYGIATQNVGLMEIRIKDECRQPQNVVAFPEMADSPRFKTWFQQPVGQNSAQKNNFKDLQAFKEKCFFTNGMPESEYDGGFGFKSKCAQIVDDYITSSQAKVIQDFANRKSFYIRDRNCIETIKGSAKDLVELAAKDDLMWLPGCDDAEHARLGYSYNRIVGPFNRLLKDALGDYPKPISPEVIDKIIENQKLSGIDTTAVEIYKRCAKKNRLSEYRAFAKKNYQISASPIVYSGGGYAGAKSSPASANTDTPWANVCK